MERRRLPLITVGHYRINMVQIFPHPMKYHPKEKDPRNKLLNWFRTNCENFVQKNTVAPPMEIQTKLTLVVLVFVSVRVKSPGHLNCGLLHMRDSLQIQPPHVGCLLRPPREASEIRADKFHTDDVSLLRIQPSLPNGSLHEMQHLNQHQQLNHG